MQNVCYFLEKISFVKIYALCREIHFVAIYAFLCGEKFIQNFSSWIYPKLFFAAATASRHNYQNNCSVIRIGITILILVQCCYFGDSFEEILIRQARLCSSYCLWISSQSMRDSMSEYSDSSPSKTVPVAVRTWSFTSPVVRTWSFTSLPSSPPLTSFSPPPSNCWKLARLQSDLPITLISRDGLADDGGNGGTGGIGGGGDRVGG